MSRNSNVEVWFLRFLSMMTADIYLSTYFLFRVQTFQARVHVIRFLASAIIKGIEQERMFASGHYDALKIGLQE